MGNADKRILNARRTLHGPRDGLDNIIGYQIDDGTQCYVIEEQANYRFVAECKLAVDGRFVVKPNGGQGRWVRENGGLVGFALLDTGSFDAKGGGEPATMVYGKPILPCVQFEERDGLITYVGTAPRLALLLGSAVLNFDRGSADLYIMDYASGLLLASTHVAQAGTAGVSGSTMLLPGERLCLKVRAQEVATGRGSFRVVLV